MELEAPTPTREVPVISLDWAVPQVDSYSSGRLLYERLEKPRGNITLTCSRQNKIPKLRWEPDSEIRVVATTVPVPRNWGATVVDPTLATTKVNGVYLGARFTMDTKVHFSELGKSQWKVAQRLAS